MDQHLKWEEVVRSTFCFNLVFGAYVVERERACCCRRLEAIIRLTLHLPVWPHILGKRAVLPGYPSLSLSQWHRGEYLGDRLASATRRERHILQSSRCRGTCILTRRSPSSTGEVQVFGTWSCVRGRRSMSLLVLDSKTWRVGGLGSLVDNMTLAHNVMAITGTCTCTYNERSKQRTLPCLDTRWRLASPCTLWLDIRNVKVEVWSAIQGM